MDALSTILLHVDDTAVCVEHAHTVQLLADRFDAHADAVYAVTPSVARYPAMTAFEGAWWVASEFNECDRKQRAATKIRFIQALPDTPRVRWCDRAHATTAHFAEHALYADMVVMRSGPRDDGSIPIEFPAAVAIESGRPVLLLPDAPIADVGRTVLVAWKPTREAARSVTLALPWLRRASAVHLVTADTPDRSDAASAARIVRYLSAHGVRCHVLPPVPDAHDAGSALRARSVEVGADLLVMGCYGHSRAREWLLGGTTRTLTREPALPVLMAH